MVLKEGEIVKVDYTAMDEKGEVFDTTIEKKAVDAGIYNEKRKYKPSVAVVGERNFFEKVDETIKSAEQGKKIALELEPKDAFGERNADYIRMIPMREFKAKKVVPFPGMPVEINNMQGKVQTVSGGRVRVDFNHPLAGKKVKYDIEVKEIINEKAAKVAALLEKYFPFVAGKNMKHELKAGILEVMLPEKFSQGTAPIRKAFSESALKHVAGLEKVRFVEEYVKEAEKEKPAEAKKEEAEAGKSEKTEKKPEGKASENTP